MSSCIQMAPILLDPSNVTPPARTPWGGRRLALRWKPCLATTAGPVGESWEISAGEELPSRTHDGRALPDVLAADPGPMLGDERPREPGAPGERPGTALLIKLLDTAAPLSVQIHPKDGAPSLTPGEGGKPESWYVLEAAPGAGVYVGLAPEVDAAGMAAALANGGDVSALLGFVEVRPGDFFVLDAGVPHAIGPGVTLVEPQRVTPGRRGVTYRYWDWNRRYDERGREDPGGRPRALHVDAALAVTNWRSGSTAEVLARRFLRAGPAALDAPAREEPLAGPAAPIAWDALSVARWVGSGAVPLRQATVLRGLVVVEGTVSLAGPWGDVRVDRGHAAVLPAALAAGEARLDRAHAIVASVVCREA